MAYLTVNGNKVLDSSNYTDYCTPDNIGAAASTHTHEYLPLSGGTVAGPIVYGDGSHSNIMLRTHDSWKGGIGWDHSGNEALSLWAKNPVTRLRWNAGTDMSSMTAGTMMGITPDFEISKASGSAKGYIGGNEISTTNHTHNYLPLSGGTISGTITFDDGVGLTFKSKGGATNPQGLLGYNKTSISGFTMHCVNTYQTDGALYLQSNGYNGANDTGGIAIDNEGVTVFGAGDSGTNFTGVFRVINEDNVAAGPVFLVTKAGACSGVTFKATSDINLKENIKQRTFDLSSIKTYEYNFKDDESKEKKIGLIAQEVAKVIPEAVTKSSSEDAHLELDYNAVVAALVSVVNDQNIRIHNLEQQLINITNYYNSNHE